MGVRSGQTAPSTEWLGFAAQTFHGVESVHTGRAACGTTEGFVLGAHPTPSVTAPSGSVAISGRSKGWDYLSRRHTESPVLCNLWHGQVYGGAGSGVAAGVRAVRLKLLTGAQLDELRYGVDFLPETGQARRYRECHHRGMAKHRFRAPLWEHAEGEPGSWHFLTVPAELSEDLRAEYGPGEGFGSIRVHACIGATGWDTSLFPDTARGGFVLPVKKAVRRAEGLEVGQACDVGVELGSRSA